MHARADQVLKDIIRAVSLSPYGKKHRRTTIMYARIKQIIKGKGAHDDLENKQYSSDEG